MPPNQQNPYDFIMSNNSSQKRSPLNNTSMKVRIIIVAAGFIILIMVALIISSLLSSGDKDHNQRLLELTQKQSEIIRVSTLADKGAKDSNTRILAANTRISTQSSLQQTKKVLAQRGIGDKAVTKQLAAGKNAKTDAALTEATANNRFDETFTTIIDKQLTDYQKLLQAAFEGSTKSEQTVITASFNSTKLLITKPATESDTTQ